MLWFPDFVSSFIIIPYGPVSTAAEKNEKGNAATVGNHLSAPFKNMQPLKFRR